MKRTPGLEDSRDAIVWRMIDALWRDTRHATRRLVKDWQFSAGAITILALGIGANTAVFSLLNSSLFQPHPFTDSARLVNLYQNDAKSGEPEGVSYPAYLDLQRETAVFAALGAAELTGTRYQTVDAKGRTGTVRGALAEYVSTNHLDVLGMRPSLGRWFTADEERRADPVAVLGWTVWKQDFAADPNVLGQTLIVGGVPVQVIGVGPVALNCSENPMIVTGLWMPLSRVDLQRSSDPGDPPNLLERRESLFLQVRARLRDGVTIQQAQAAMDVAARRFAADYPDKDPKRGITVMATNDVHVHPREKLLKPVAIAGLSVVGLVLAIACSNLATLLLVRSSARRAEISVRLALGASRAQLVRHLLMESFVLAMAGSAAGVALAHWGLRYLSTVDLPVILSMQLDYRVLGFAVVVATLCGLGFGLTPALQATRTDIAGALRDEKGSSGTALSLARGWFTVKNALVTGQVTASFLLLVAAALALGILTATQSRSVGYRPEGLAVINTDPRYARYDLPRARAVFEQLRQRIAALPGVESVFLTTELPIDGQFEKDFRVDGSSGGETHRVEGRWANGDYFRTIGIPVLFGRVFDERDTPQSQEVIVVSEAFARHHFGTPNAVGKRIRYEDDNTRAVSAPVEIVGVVGNVRSIDHVADTPKKSIYRSDAQAELMPTTIVARTSRDDNALVALMQQEVRRLNPELPVTNAITMKQRQGMELAPFRAALILLGTLGGLGLLLAGVGLYAVVAYAVAQRTNELGIRIALGASPGDLMRLVVRDVTTLVAAGIVIGGAISWTGLILIESSLARIDGVNLWSVAGVALMIVVSGVVAAFVPTRRAIRTDPIAAIRYQ